MSNSQISPLPFYTVVDRIAVEVHPDRTAMGRTAARAAAECIAGAVAANGEARVIFACAPSQDEFLSALVDPDACGISVPWEKVTAFHMDDYVGISSGAPQSFRYYLQEHLLKHVNIGKFFPLEADSPDLGAVAQQYARELRRKPIDLICMGIGENGHIAFNDPPVADFDDPELVKIVELDPGCRQQQVNDGCFPNIEAVPRHALTLTIPVFRSARRLSVHVPGALKAKAVDAALNGSISPACPASILRLHPAVTLYLDMASASLAFPSQP